MRWLLLFCLLLCPALRAEVPVPALQARVTDLTGTLDAAERSALEARLQAFEQRKGSQIAILVVPTTQPESIEQYGIRVAEQWRLGRKGSDDGLIVLVAKNDRSVRIEVGYGLEGVIPDAVAHRIIDEILVPRFRAGDFAGGLDEAVTRLTGLIAGEPLPPPRPVATAAGTSGDGGGNALGSLLIAALVAGQVLRALFGPLLAGLVVGAGGVAAGWLLLGSPAAALLLGVAGFVLTLFGVMAFAGGMGGSNRSDGGGFGGGGGGFGGGGASGRW